MLTNHGIGAPTLVSHPTSKQASSLTLLLIAPFQSHWPTLVNPSPLEQPSGIIERLLLLDLLLPFRIGGAAFEGNDHGGGRVGGRGCNWSIFAVGDNGEGKR
ncbi:hypothetical protein PIB30_017082 [Stylosanthes scabra]|uniref:Uncharacterized protein n=1 Tax=Stylosanthes scabra TaxID=79078 RepID=A0ABU6T774_9FABA|nr:hypothetical protein [Stylosanthes scabra]